jgi:protease stability complex PrcB-like protein
VSRAWALLLGALLQTVLSPVRSLDKGSRSEVTTERQVAVRDAGEWASLWRQHAPNRPQPSVDFSREMVVGVYLGTRPTPGFSVEVTGYREAGDGAVVLYREASPPRDLIVAQVLTFPYHLVAIPKRTGTITFEKLKP